MSGALARLVHKLPFVTHPYVAGHAPERAREERLPRRCETRTFHGFEGLPRADGERELGGNEVLLVHHPSPRPPRGPGLTVMTYNILLGGLRREALLGYLEALESSGRLPDVLGLQEANQPISVELARRFGFHLAYFGASPAEGVIRHLINGKAFLSRHPILQAEHYTYVVGDEERRAAIERRGEPGELDEDRGALRVVVRAEGREVSLYCVHHTLGDSSINASNLRQLHHLVRECGGNPAVVLGDFNANVSVKRDGSWLMAHLRRNDETHTVEEFQARYGTVFSSVGDIGVGNIGDQRVRHALRDLEAELPETLCAGDQVRVRLGEDRLIEPKEARRLLHSGTVEKDSEEFRRLQDAADATTLNSEPDATGKKPATGKRFDTLFATRDLRPVYVELDHATEASDHHPVTAHYRF